MHQNEQKFQIENEVKDEQLFVGKSVSVRQAPKRSQNIKKTYCRVNLSVTFV